MGITLEEYEAKFTTKPKPVIDASVPRNTTLSFETRAKISQRLKEKWLDPEFRKDRMQLPSRTGEMRERERDNTIA